MSPVSCRLVTYLEKSLQLPTDHAPRSSAVTPCTGVLGLPASTSAPCEISALTASFSLAGSFQVLTQMTLQVTLGLTLRAPITKPFSRHTTCGTGNAPTQPSTLLLVIRPAITPPRYDAS